MRGGFLQSPTEVMGVWPKPRQVGCCLIQPKGAGTNHTGCSVNVALGSWSSSSVKSPLTSSLCREESLSKMWWHSVLLQLLPSGHFPGLVVVGEGEPQCDLAWVLLTTWRTVDLFVMVVVPKLGVHLAEGRARSMILFPSRVMGVAMKMCLLCRSPITGG